ncbi:hypothetical protein [uncultured Thermus sp.]|uniref:hypothetical protein n=1 Tax=uncultured Thermus sp. TaxID=157149 RepID=UPI00261EE4AC|nr:hypothetical protein [uncultured Thermus sp.]
MTSLEQFRLHVEEALRRYWECVKAEEEEYAEDYERVTFMEYEAPAPDPCAEAFSRLVAVGAYGEAWGRREDLDLGALRERVYGALDKG